MELQNQYAYSNMMSYSKVGQKQHKRKKDKGINKHEDDDIEDKEERKRKNQQYMNVLSDLARLRDHYYSVYLSKLETKVQKQRKKLKAREERFKQELLEKEAEKAKKAHQVTHRLPKVKVTNDVEYLRHVPKSRYYHLIAVEELMKSRGLLKHRFEVEDFWKKAREDQKLWHRPLPVTLSPDRLTEHILSRYSSQTFHSKADQSTTTGKPLLYQVEPLPGILKKPMESSDEEISPSFERPESPPLVFPPKPKFPKLHSFNKNLFSKSSPASIVSSSTHDKEFEESANPRTTRRKIQHHLKKDAYDVAVVNTAMTGRLMKRHGVQVDALKPLSEITEIWCTQSETSSQASKSTKTNSTATRRPTKSKSNHHRSNKVVQALPEDTKLDAIQEDVYDVDAASLCEPLSMDMMITRDNVSVKDVKKQNPVWINYADVEDPKSHESPE